MYYGKNNRIHKRTEGFVFGSESGVKFVDYKDINLFTTPFTFVYIP